MRRRDVLWCGPALIAPRAWGEAAPDGAIARYEQASGGHIGFHAENTRTGRTLSWRGDERFVMCSTFKASLAALVLRRVDQHQDRLDAPVSFGPKDVADAYAPVARANLQTGVLTVGQMCAAAVEQSDNTCATLLLTRVGGPAAVTRFWRSLGDGISRLDDPEPLLNRTPLGGVRDTTTPKAMAATLKAMVLGPVLSAPSRRRLTDWLIGCTTGKDRLRSGLPRSWVTGDKTGNNGKDASGDLAVTWPPSQAPIIITAYTRGGAPTDAQLAAVFAAVGHLAAERLAA